MLKTEDVIINEYTRLKKNSTLKPKMFNLYLAGNFNIDCKDK